MRKAGRPAAGINWANRQTERAKIIVIRRPASSSLAAKTEQNGTEEERERAGKVIKIVVVVIGRRLASSLVSLATLYVQRPRRQTRVLSED